MTTKAYNSPKAKLAEELSELDSTIICRSGLKGGKPDVLTCRTQDLPSKEKGKNSSETPTPMFHSSRLHKTPIESDWILLDTIQECRTNVVVSVHFKQLGEVQFEHEFIQAVVAAGKADGD